MTVWKDKVKNKKVDIKQDVTDRIVARLEDVDSFEMPFESFRSKNIASGKFYRGINIMLLAFAPYNSPYWGTYKQWTAKGAQVRTGEKATHIVFWKMRKVKEEDENGEEVEKTIPLSRYYPVFNAEQVDGWEAPEHGMVDETEIISSADCFFDALSMKVETRNEGRACYKPLEDKIQMPPREAFNATKTSSATEAYYSTLAHECTHATGHKERCDREMNSYAAEELVAEIGAAMLCGQLGISNEMRDDHVAYIKSWLKALNNDKTFIFKTASKAQEAIDWMETKQEVLKKAA